MATSKRTFRGPDISRFVCCSPPAELVTLVTIPTVTQNIKGVRLLILYCFIVATTPRGVNVPSTAPGTVQQCENWSCGGRESRVLYRPDYAAEIPH